MSALFDFPSLLVVLLLFISAATFTRSIYPTIFDSPPSSSNTTNDINIGNSMTGLRNPMEGRTEHVGIKGLCWKASRVGERLSPYVAGACLLMAFHVLFIKA